MQTIKELASSLVVISVVGSVILILAPSGSMEKSIKTVVSIVMLTVFVKPFLGRIDFNELDLKSSISYENSEYKYNDYIVADFSNEIKNRIVSLLKKEGIFDIKVETEIIINKDELLIESVKLKIPKHYDEFKVKAINIVKKELGIVASVEVVD